MDKSETPQEELRTDIHQALRSWHKADYAPGSLLSNLLIVQSAGESLPPQGGLDATHLSVNRVLLEGLVALGEQDKELEGILRKRFLDQQTSRDIGYQLNFSEDTINRRQSKAMDQLAAIIRQREAKAREDYIHEFEGWLAPQTYTQLFGVEQLIQVLVDGVLEEGEPWLLLLVGIGGIGKTAAADQAVRRVIGHFRFQQIAFVRAEPFSFSGRSESPERTFEQITMTLAKALGITEPGADHGRNIRRRLKEKPHLIIVDNIEEADDAAFLLAQLADWARPSKFIITSRARPISAQATTVVTLNELSSADSLTLLRFEAKKRDIAEMAAAADEELTPLYETLGGNPLALKLAVALLEIMPLPAILADLRHAGTSSTKDMYQHIYRKAWGSLSTDAQALLEAMPLVGETGSTQEQLQAITKLNNGRLWQAVQELTARSLLELRGTIWERRYGIHRLTETFLNSEITGWDNQPGPREQDS